MYDAFVSYARADEGKTDFLANRIADLREAFRSRAGRELRLFIDTAEIKNAQLWEQRINLALRSSATFVAVVTASYPNSEWCTREWNIFVTLERWRRDHFKLRTLHIIRLSRPIHRCITKIVSSSADTNQQLREMRKRQYTDLIGLPANDPEYVRRVHRLGADLIQSLKKITEQDIGKASEANLATHSNGPVGGTLTPLVAAHSGIDEAEFARRLARARSATIVGVTNSWLRPCLEDAITLKKEQEGPSAFWEHLHIVFLAEELLPHVRDELTSQFYLPVDSARERLFVPVRQDGASCRCFFGGGRLAGGNSILIRTCFLLSKSFLF